MRRLGFLLAVLVVFAALAERVWVESALLAEAYRIRSLEREIGSMRHRENELRADIAKRAAQGSIVEKGKELGIDDLGLGRGRTLPRVEGDGDSPEAH